MGSGFSNYKLYNYHYKFKLLESLIKDDTINSNSNYKFNNSLNQNNSMYMNPHMDNQLNYQNNNYNKINNNNQIHNDNLINNDFYNKISQKQNNNKYNNNLKKKYYQNTNYKQNKNKYSKMDKIDNNKYTKFLKTNLGSLEFNNVFINASGCYCQFVEDLDKIYNKNICNGSIISKTSTLKQRRGNPEPRYFEEHELQYTFNSMGLPNMGLIYYLEYFKNKCLFFENKNIRRHKNHFVSLGGLTLQENLDMIDIIYCEEQQYYLYIDAIELNFSCPNIPGKCQLGYDFDNMDEYLKQILTKITKKEIQIQYKNNNFTYINNDDTNNPTNTNYINYTNKLQIGIKLPPYFDNYHFKVVSDILIKYDRLDFITCINSIGNGLIIDSVTDSVVIKPKNGLGGLGGSIVKPTSLANVHRFYKLLGDRINIIGCGGILTGTDAYEHILAGASLLSVGSALMLHDEYEFNQIASELVQIMESKGHKNINDFKGKLKYL